MSGAADREDFLEEDAEIPGQKFCLLSFLSPEKVLANKNLFFFEKFLDTYEFSIRTKNLEAFLVKAVSDINAKLDKQHDEFLAADLSGAAELCRNARLRVDTVVDDLQKFVKANEKEMRASKLKEAFDDFMFAGRSKLEDEFFAKNDFRTTVRGLKVRGVYGSQGEAVARSKKLQRQDPLHNIFVGEVGKWLPWDPEPTEVAEQEYAEEQLNTLMKKYKENEEQREAFQRENRNLGAAGGKKKLAEQAGPVDAAATTESSVPAIGGAAPTGESFSSMFESTGPADLAIARKLQKKEGEN
jgi:hypothetical protein